MKFYKIISLLSLMPLVALSESMNIEPEQINSLRIHTDLVTNSSITNYVTLNISNIEGCSKGVFFNAENNQETLSVALTALVSKSSAVIGYEPTIKTPWGNNSYCAMTYFEINL